MAYPKHLVCVGALVENSDAKVLLVKTELRGWDLPGGQVEEGEDILAAIRREVQEESGIEIEELHTVAVYSSLDSPSKVIFDFTARYHGGELRPNLGETAEVAWVIKDEALAMVQTDATRLRLEWLLAGPKSLRYVAFTKSPFAITESLEL